jgi:sugar/nucleoside kinase (ribokinase family)
VRIRIEASDLPGSCCGPSPDSPGGYHNVHVGLQRRGRPAELLGLVPGDAPSATWTVDCDGVPAPAGADLKGAYIQGPPDGRFI